MNHSLRIYLTLFLLLFFKTYGWSNQFEEPDMNSLKHRACNFSNTGFIENRGQLTDENGNVAKSVLAYCRKNNLQIFVTENGFTFVFHQLKNGADSLIKVEEIFLDANLNRGNIDWIETKNSAHLNYYNPNYKNGILDLFEYKKIRIRNIYNGIDLILELSDTTFKYSFNIAANIDEKQIRMEWKGSEVALNKVSNCLKASTRFGDLVEKKLIGWQQNVFLAVNFLSNEKNIISYNIPNRNLSKPVTIDPLVVWTTMFGGVNTDCATAVAIDSTNNFYVTGYTASFFFPLQNAGTYFSSLLQGGADIFISHFDANLHLKWCTFYGGSMDDAANGIKTDRQGNVFITGFTKSQNFPTQFQPGTYSQVNLNQSLVAGSSDALLLKFNNSGSRIFSTFLGGTANDIGHDLVINSSGNVYLIGRTLSNNFPTQNYSGGFFQSSLNGNQDAFVAEFSNNGALNWSSYFGGNGLEEGNSISIDNANNIFIAGGTTDSTLFPLFNNGSFFQNHTDSMEAFVAKFSNNNILQWSTFYGGTTDDVAMATAIDNNGNIFIAGNTFSGNFPTYASGNLAFRDSVLNKSTIGFFSDVFLLKFSNSGNRLWSTLLGGSDNDAIQSLVHYMGYFDDYINDALVTDNCGNVTFSFTTSSGNLDLKQEGCSGYFDNNLSGQTDAAIARFSNRSELKWLTYYGGGADETGMAMVLDGQSNILSAMNTDNSFGYYYQSQFPNAYIQVSSYLSSVNQDFILNKFQPVQFDANITYSKCSSGCTGSAQAIVNASCPLSSFQYIWSNGVSSSAVTNLCTGNYSVIITDTAFSCVSDTLKFNLHHGFQAYPQFSNQICSHLCNGTATVQLPGISSFTTTWYTPDSIIYFTNPVSNLCAGNDTVIVNVPGCGSDTSIFKNGIYPPLGIYLNALYPNDLSPCPFACNGLVQVVLIGGQQPPYCSWSNGITGTSDSFLCATHSYTVTATDSVCYTSSLQVQMPNPYVESFKVQVNQSSACLPVNSATITPKYFGKPTKYLWSNGDTTATVNNLAPGNYTCIISDSCVSDTAHITLVHVTPRHLTVHILQSQYSCNCTNIIKCAFDTAGYQPYTYYWFNISKHDTTITQLPILDSLCRGDSIILLIKDLCGDSAFASYVIDSGGFQIHINYTNSCFNSCTYKASVTNSPIPHYTGTPPYTYIWSNGLTGVVDTNLCPNTMYYVIGYDNCGRRDSQSVTIHPVNTPLSVSISGTPACYGLCNGTGIVHVNSGLPPYRYRWSTGQTTNYISGLCAGQTYWCVIKDTCGDSIKKKIIISLPPPPTLVTTTSPACPSLCNATIAALPSGLGPFTFLWNTGATTSSITNACQGITYTCKVYDQCNDSTSQSATASVAGAMTLAFITSGSCSHYCTGFVSANISGGLPPYNFHWSNGATGNTLFSACANKKYRCTVTDFCGDTITDSVIVPVLPNNFQLNFQTTASCHSTCTGKIKAVVSGGYPPYNYLWNNNLTTANINNVCDSIYYTCRIIDNCADTLFDSVFVPARAIFKDSFLITNAQCGFNCSASAKTIVYGGVVPYFYHWDNGSTAQTRSSLCADSTYFCVITDGCGSDTAWLRMPHVTASPLFAMPILGNPVCSNTCNGSANIAINGGVVPYYFIWSNGNNTTYANNLCGGTTYACNVTDACNQQYSVSFVMPAYGQLNASVQVLSTTCDNSCHDKAIIIASGGKLPYQYKWNTGDTTFLDTIICPSKNYCKVTDGCNSIDSVSFIIRKVIKLQNFIDSIVPTCPLLCNGSAVINTVGGLMPYRYLWQSGDTFNYIKNICGGNYLCVIKDNCHHVDSLQVNIPFTKSLQSDSIKTTATCVGNCSGKINLHISGGSKPYHYVWNTGDTISHLSSLCPGIYTILITNPSCSSDSLYDTIQLVSSLQTTTQIMAAPKCYSACNAVALTTPVGINPPYSFIWNTNTTQNNSLDSQLCAGINFVKITDKHGCIVYDTISIVQPKQLLADTIFTPAHCFNSDGAIIAHAKGGTKPYHYVWSNNIFIDTIKNIPSGNYNLIITDSNGCVLNSNFTLNSTSAHIYVSHDTIVHIGSIVNLFAYGAQKYFWHPNNFLNCDTCANVIWNGNAPQTYCVIGTDKYGCIDSACLTIDIYNVCGDLADIKMANAFSPNTDGKNDLYKPIVEMPDCYSDILFRIYNRWGEQLFESTDFNSAWDGTFKGRLMPIETYVWYLKVKNYLGEEKMMKGDVILIR